MDAEFRSFCSVLLYLKSKKRFLKAAFVTHSSLAIKQEKPASNLLFVSPRAGGSVQLSVAVGSVSDPVHLVLHDGGNQAGMAGV
jgi:hypothetical protein